MNVALILAGGCGSRLAHTLRVSAPPKQFLPLAGRAMLLRTIDAFETHPDIGAIRLVCAPAWSGRLKYMLESENYRKVSPDVTDGGIDRRESAKLGLSALLLAHSSDDIVLIHDAARPLVTAELISACIKAAKDYGACAAAVPVTDTLYAARDGIVEEIPNRSRFFAAQTPQAFRLGLICTAHQQLPPGAIVTDDAAVALASGIAVHIVPGDPRNLKLTTPEDFPLAEQYLRDKNEIHTETGDSHDK